LGAKLWVADYIQTIGARFNVLKTAIFHCFRSLKKRGNYSIETRNIPWIRPHIGHKYPLWKGIWGGILKENLA